MQGLLQNKKLMIIIGVVVLIIIGIILAIVFGNKPATKVAVSNPTVELVWWKPKFSSIVYSDTINSFKTLAGNQNVTIRQIDVPFDEDYYRNLITDFARGRGPDIFSFRNDDFASLKEFMTPISGVAGVTESKLLADYKTNFVDSVVQSGTDLDKVYGVSSYVDNLQLYYNKNLLQQAGIAQPPSTWADLEKQLVQLNKRGLDQKFTQSAISLGTGYLTDKADASQGYNIANYNDILATLVVQNGGQLYDYTTSLPTFGQNRNQKDVATGNITDKSFNVKFDQDNPTYKAVKFYMDFAQPNNTRYSWNTESKLSTDAFMEGKLAYTIGYSTFQDDINQRNSRLQYGVSELPQLDLNNKKTYGTFMMDGISRQLEIDSAKNPKDVDKAAKLEKAREFMNYLMTPESQKAFFAKTNLPAARKDIIDLQTSGDEKLRIFAAGNLYAFTYYKPDPNRVDRMWGNLIYNVQFQNLTLDESLTKAIQEYALAVQKGPRIRM
jgi:ABC-type glycerol-3-phosphate transport system substrate-binding protein